MISLKIGVRIMGFHSRDEKDPFSVQGPKNPNSRKCACGKDGIYAILGNNKGLPPGHYCEDCWRKKIRPY